MEKLLPRQVTNKDQREVLQLLCRAHALEVENTELQADSLCRRSLLCQKDFVIQRYHRHRLLCEQLIQGQRQLMRGEAGSRRSVNRCCSRQRNRRTRAGEVAQSLKCFL